MTFILKKQLLKQIFLLNIFCLISNIYPIENNKKPLTSTYLDLLLKQAAKENKNDKKAIEKYINKQSSQNAKAYMAKRYFYFYGDPNVKESKRPNEFLTIDAPYGFSINELIDFKKLPSKLISSKKILDLSNFKINSLDGLCRIPGVNKVVTLNLENNEITELKSNTFDCMPELNKLNLQSNKIDTIMPDAFNGTALVDLNFSDNMLTELKDKSFAGLEKNLKELNLNDNFISKLSPNAFEGLTKLVNLRLEDSKIPDTALFDALDKIERDPWSGNLYYNNATKTLIKMLEIEGIKVHTNHK